ncbi:MAG: hypothetical protein M3Q74_13225 [Pseudomonadota bacterium]|nr:hypothetical protein [Pseudomonadota bacterium]
MTGPLTEDEEARLLALLGVGPKPEDDHFYWLHGRESERFTLLSWQRLHDTGALLAWCETQGWYVRVEGGHTMFAAEGEWYANLGDIGPGGEYADGAAADPRTALARAILAATEEAPP